MSQPKVTRRKISDYSPAKRNPNAGSVAGLAIIEDSLEANGAGRSLLADKDGELIAGNHTWEAAVNRGIEDVIEVETDGHSLVVVKRTDLDLDTDARAKALQMVDNISNQRGYVQDDAVVAEMLMEIHASDKAALKGTGFTADDVQAMIDVLSADSGEGNEGGVGENDAVPLTMHDVPDAIWPTDNSLGIPLLDINMQADAVDLPVSIWGATSRSARMKGTWLFYTEDYRYEALWKDPTPILNSSCVNIAEPNFSCYGQMPVAVGLWTIYRKRWLARYWQSKGIRVFVDLNVNERFYDVNLLGVPHGWKAYTTRGYSERLDSTEHEYEIACERAGTSSILFVVYGGGKVVEQRAKERGWIWFNEEMQRFKRDG